MAEITMTGTTSTVMMLIYHLLSARHYIEFLFPYEEGVIILSTFILGKN